jgi:hypothetical protein
MPSVVSEMLRWRRWRLFVILRRQYVLRSSATLFLHLTQPAFHSLHVVVQLRRPVKIVVMAVHGISMYLTVAELIILFTFETERCQRSVTMPGRSAVAEAIKSLWGPRIIKYRGWRG